MLQYCRESVASGPFARAAFWSSPTTMGRPRINIRVRQLPDGTWGLVKKGGTEVPCVSFHKATGQFYTLLDTGQRAYLGPYLEPVVKQYLLREPSLRGRVVTALQEIEELGGEDALREIPEDLRHQLDSFTKLELPGLIDWMEAKKDTDPTARVLYNDYVVKSGSPEKQLPPLSSAGDGQPQPQEEPTKQRLRDALTIWEKHKAEEGCGTDYVKDVRAVFLRFVGLVGNKRLFELNADDFAEWRRWIVKHGAGRSNKWMNDQNKKVASLLLAVKRDKPGWPIPDGIKQWSAVWKTKQYVVNKKNRQAMPVEQFQALLAVARGWQGADPEAYPKDTQKGKAQRLQARLKRQEGLRWEAILRLAANCALDNIDCRTIRWEQLRLNEPLPHMAFPRKKVEKATGAAVDRFTPLLPSTVEAIKRYRSVQPHEGPVFRTARGGPFSDTTFYYAFANLAQQAGVTELTFKHIRNVAPTLGKRNKLSKDERDAILGHVVAGTSKFYEDSVDATYLVDLVNLVGAEYFGGEQAKKVH